jgi:hypothetical protein
MKSLLSSVSRFVAMALLLSIGADIAGDATCAPPMAAGSQTSIQSQGPSGDECEGVCVPDCFCCCRAVSGELTNALLPIGRVLNLETPELDPQPDGVRARIFHPPLIRA